MYGKSVSMQIKKRISEAMTGSNNPFYDKHHTDESLQKMSVAAINRSKVKCPYCGTVGDKPNMKRWHFDNCKTKKIS